MSSRRDRGRRDASGSACAQAYRSRILSFDQGQARKHTRELSSALACPSKLVILVATALPCGRLVQIASCRGDRLAVESKSR